ncbi:MAG UNVERIFIED_CONTAM: hypothetical protein LVR29_21525 [Microcystis novacekii LVE1205-3]
MMRLDHILVFRSEQLCYKVKRWLNNRNRHRLTKRRKRRRVTHPMTVSRGIALLHHWARSIRCCSIPTLPADVVGIVAGSAKLISNDAAKRRRYLADGGDDGDDLIGGMDDPV